MHGKKTKCKTTSMYNADYLRFTDFYCPLSKPDFI